jgi:hypothetical protein
MGALAKAIAPEPIVSVEPSILTLFATQSGVSS